MKETIKGVVCPLCKTWYNADPEHGGIPIPEGWVCGNQAWDRDEDPDRNRPPCPGRLVLDEQCPDDWETEFSEMIPKRFALQKDNLTRVITFTGKEIKGIIYRYGSWALTEYGMVSLTMDYVIARDRVHEDDWEMHMLEKTWVYAHDFLTVLEETRNLWPAVAT